MKTCKLIFRIYILGFFWCVVSLLILDRTPFITIFSAFDTVFISALVYIKLRIFYSPKCTEVYKHWSRHKIFVPYFCKFSALFLLSSFVHLLIMHNDYTKKNGSVIFLSTIIKYMSDMVFLYVEQKN